MLPKIDSTTFARPSPAAEPEDVARRQRVRQLQADVIRIRGQLSCAAEIYLRTRSSADLMYQQQLSMALERALHQLRKLTKL